MVLLPRMNGCVLQVPSLMKTIPSVSIGYAVYDLTKSMLGMKPM